MKLTAILLALLSTTAYACPELTGKYACMDSEGVQDLEISQTEELGVTTYNLNFESGTFTLITDGTTKPQTVVIEGDHEVVQYKYRAACLNDRLVILMFLDTPTEILDQSDIIVSKAGEGIKYSSISRLNGEISETETTYCVPRT